MSVNLQPIATIHTPYTEKFAVPRQPGLAAAATGDIVFSDDIDVEACCRGIEGFSHLWLVFLFHQTAAQGWQPLVRPPRLGGNQKVGVFASRSTFRPNPIGMSVVRNLGLATVNQQTVLRVGGMDLVDGTPLLDIKPYVPYADSVPDAIGGYAQSSPPMLAVSYSPEAEQQLSSHRQRYPDLPALLGDVLGQDPRPAYRQGQQDERVYGVSLYDLNIRFCVTEQGIQVIAISHGENPSRQGKNSL
ncbi:tRNA (N6-threonylcarbamoyladenosine(37)-N6)-methyltransferase TrmO [Aestuariibacter halophilus]|uniref:tRNA (N6-threonylcarbamoyladenosine(37)-N6)-methyltransferase TrmO n=1 Tax=Fluctibacter halophilus TaxID=226011 RepID=A0ABS8GC91_9ALTE|nr:tRNA (N6-threonylcarbamoyladenosine(37)-N6)-methyltransferase TrmO [Aestuariibacter halophilus]MCC2618187.1 tRNA (N6-threonylcarbamoyladenosine(37)-N6)-methyltransferase TrmO [Aestuariibacter halophilus]